MAGWRWERQRWNRRVAGIPLTNCFAPLCAKMFQEFWDSVPESKILLNAQNIQDVIWNLEWRILLHLVLFLLLSENSSGIKLSRKWCCDSGVARSSDECLMCRKRPRLGRLCSWTGRQRRKWIGGIFTGNNNVAWSYGLEQLSSMKVDDAEDEEDDQSCQGSRAAQ